MLLLTLNLLPLLVLLLLPTPSLLPLNFLLILLLAAFNPAEERPPPLVRLLCFLTYFSFDLVGFGLGGGFAVVARRVSGGFGVEVAFAAALERGLV